MTTPLPCAKEAQQALIGTLALYPGHLKACEEHGIDERHFQEPQVQLWRAIVTADAHGLSYESANLFPRLPEYLGNELTSCVALGQYPARLPDYCRTLCETHDRREAFLLNDRLARALAEQGDTWREVVAGLHELDTSPQRLPRAADAATWAAEPPPKPEELIEGLLHRGSKMVLGGGSKSFKTWTLLDLAASVATGSDFWGYPCTAGRVLYVNFEIQEGFIAERIREICEARGITLPPERLEVLNLRGYAADATVLLPLIIRQARRRGYVLIILDPLYKLLGSRDENASSQMADLMNAIERLAVATGAATAFGSHFAKGNAAAKESIDRISGSGVFARDPDTILTMTRHEKLDAFTVDLTLRNHPPQDPFVVRRQHPLMVIDPRLDPKRLKLPNGRRAETDSEELLALLEGEGSTFKEWYALSKEHLGISLATFKRRRKELLRDGKIWLSALDQKYARRIPATRPDRTDESVPWAA